MQILPARMTWRVQRLPWQAILTSGLILLAIALAALAYLLAVQSMATAPVVVAATTLPPGTRLDAQHLRVIQVPRQRDATLQGVSDPALVVGQYTTRELSAGQLLQGSLVQSQPLATHVFVNDPLPAETLTGTMYELPRTGLGSLTSQDRLNILVRVDPSRGTDARFSVGTMDRPGSGSRVVRVLHSLEVRHVTERVAVLDLTPEQSAYLHALDIVGVSLVGELSTTAADPLGVIHLADVALPDLAMPEAAPESQNR